MDAKEGPPDAAHFARAMALNSADNTTFAPGDINSFMKSLDLSPDNEARVREILEALPEVNATTEVGIVARSASNEKRSVPILVTAGCQISRVAFGSSTLLEDAPIQQAVSQSWSQTCWEDPRCVVQPTKASQVSQAMKIINFLKIPFAVRSGGHSPNPGWAGVDSGILIDMSKMNSMSISGDAKTFSVGPGQRWGKVYEYLDPHNVTVVGGRVAQVGVGGLLLGGGLSYWTGEFGLATDNVANFEVVLADGSIVNANAKERSDLFWGLKGGGPNFGIVTKFDLNTIPIKDIWYQLSVHSVDQAPALLEAFATWQKSPDTKGSVAMVISLTSIIVGLIYSRPTPKPETFNAFYNITPLVTAVPSSIGTVQKLNLLGGSTGASTALRHDYRGASSKIDADLYKDVYKVWRDKATAVNAATGANTTFVLQHVPKNVVDQGNAKGGNALGLEPISQQWWTTLVDWDDAANDDAARSVGITTTEAWKDLSTARNLDIPFLYMNDASRDQNPLDTYPAANIKRLKVVAAKYDPLRVFQTLQNDGFLLSKVKQ